MAAKTTLTDVARKAGVGTATVDRVLNERENVSDATRKKVLDAARQLGIKRILPGSYHRIVRIEVLLARPELPLIARMNTEFRRLSSGINRSVTIHRKTLADEAPRTLAKALLDTKCDGVIVYAQDHPLVNDAIEQLDARGVLVVAMISDLPTSRRVAYAGMNHYKAGRTAGALMSRMVAQKGPLVVLCNHLGFQSHEARVRGFSEYLAEHASDLPIVTIVEGGDDRVRSEARLRSGFAGQRDIVGIYNVGAANLGVAAAIRADILERRPVFIGHELTEYTIPLLREGIMTLTIDQAPEQQAQFAIDVLLHEFGFEYAHNVSPPYLSPVPIIVYTAENIHEGIAAD